MTNIIFYPRDSLTQQMKAKIAAGERSVLAAELLERLAAVANAIATQRLEGLEVDLDTIADLNRVAYGELTLDDARVRLHERIAAGKLAG